MQTLWNRAEQANETFENLLFLLQAYHTSMLQAFLDADNLAVNLASFFPSTHPHREFLNSFCECQQTLREVANDLLSERFAERTQAPIQARIAKFQQLEHLENLRKRLWSRYERDLNKYKEMVEAEARAKQKAESSSALVMDYVSSMIVSNTSANLAKDGVPTSQEIQRMKLIVEDEYRLYHDAKEHLAREIKALVENPAAYVEPAITALTLLQSQTFTLGFDLVSRVIQLNPDSISSSTSAQSFAKKKSDEEKNLETRMELVLSHELDFNDLKMKPVSEPTTETGGERTDEIDSALQDDVNRAVKERLSSSTPLETVGQKDTSEVELTTLEPVVEKNDIQNSGGHAVENIDNDSEKSTSPETHEPVVITRVVVLHAFAASEKIELSLEAGERIEVLCINDDGWWEGRNRGGEIGLFPYHSVQGTILQRLADDADIHKRRLLYSNTPGSAKPSTLSRRAYGVVVIPNAVECHSALAQQSLAMSTRDTGRPFEQV